MHCVYGGFKDILDAHEWVQGNFFDEITSDLGNALRSFEVIYFADSYALFSRNIVIF